MGFYSPASLISDARRHGVEVLGVDTTAQQRPRHPGIGRDTGGGASAGTGGASGASAVPAAACHQAGAARCAQLGRGHRRGGRRGPPPTGTWKISPAGPVLPAAALDKAPRGRLRVRLASALSRREAMWAAGARGGYRPGCFPGTTPRAGRAGAPVNDPGGRNRRRISGLRASLRHSSARAYPATAGGSRRARLWPRWPPAPRGQLPSW